jgi:AraC family ethanolamine operon transcriptional activator
MILQGNGRQGIENNHLVNEDYWFDFDLNRKADLVFPGGCIYCAVYISASALGLYFCVFFQLIPASLNKV